jgi:N-terminal domain of (some) glycogen debranching enzymes
MMKTTPAGEDPGVALCNVFTEAGDMGDTVSILDGSTFVTSDLTGDIEAGTDDPLGFFFRDTRHLSRTRTPT